MKDELTASERFLMKKKTILEQNRLKSTKIIFVDMKLAQFIKIN